MSYSIPLEIPRSRYSRFATWPLIPLIGSLVIGTLPAVIWLVANAWLLGCRDSWRQARIAIGLYAVVKVTAAISKYLTASGILKTLISDYDKLVLFLLVQMNLVCFTILMAWLAGRQEDAAQYLSSVRARKGLWWGLPLFAFLVPINIIISYLPQNNWPFITILWGARRPLEAFGLGAVIKPLLRMLGIEA